jgi:peptidoglycan/LPS O-acetylase OafA/YrhL
MTQDTPLIASQRVVQVCLLLVAAIGLFGGSLQMYLGQPETTPRLDNVHRFMAGIYLGSGLLALWVAMTVRRHETLIYLLAIAVLLGGIGRLVSISQVGLPEPAAVWLGYLVPELVLPIVIIAAQWITDGRRARS